MAMESRNFYIETVSVLADAYVQRVSAGNEIGAVEVLELLFSVSRDESLVVAKNEDPDIDPVTTLKNWEAAFTRHAFETFVELMQKDRPTIFGAVQDRATNLAQLLIDREVVMNDGDLSLLALRVADATNSFGTPEGLRPRSALFALAEKFDPIGLQKEVHGESGRTLSDSVSAETVVPLRQPG